MYGICYCLSITVIPFIGKIIIYLAEGKAVVPVQQHTADTPSMRPGGMVLLDLRSALTILMQQSDRGEIKCFRFFRVKCEGRIKGYLRSKY